MISYSFLAEASNEFLTDLTDDSISAWQHIKNIIKHYKGTKAYEALQNKLKGGAATATSLYSAYNVAMLSVAIKRLNSIIKTLMENDNISRNRAAKLFIKLQNSGDDIIKVGKDRSTSVDYLLSSSIAGPALGIIFTASNETWKSILIEYLKREKRKMLMKIGVHAPTAAVSGLTAYKLLKK